MSEFAVHGPTPAIFSSRVHHRPPHIMASPRLFPTRHLQLLRLLIDHHRLHFQIVLHLLQFHFRPHCVYIVHPTVGILPIYARTSAAYAKISRHAPSFIVRSNMNPWANEKPCIYIS